ncbi:hypothetical protein [Oceanicola sp. 502str15]|uniref:hypothetical protein n=1 Tax=Oceanicola sp. 502str15 TaxID=2696061 RepID=UPI002094A47B|nr:hypothetical protein [Oceanicola sp. 502str15]MCO6383176.1 hypothetical protein [Oceanicola sp. 502str15]
MSRHESFPPRPAPTALADALGAIRAQMAALKTCEAALCRALIAARPIGPVRGDAFTVSLHHATRTRLDPSRLPAYIRDDPAFYLSAPSTTVITRPTAPEEEGEEDDDFEVIERFG